MAGGCGIPQGAAVQFYVDHVASRRLHGFLDSQWYFTRLTSAEANPAVAIAEEAVKSARQSYELNRNRIFEKQGLPIEVLQAIQSLAAARQLYVDTVNALRLAGPILALMCLDGFAIPVKDATRWILLNREAELGDSWTGYSEVVEALRQELSVCGVPRKFWRLSAPLAAPGRAP